MRPWPEAIAKKYPLPAFKWQEHDFGRLLAHHPTRPWWSWIQLASGTTVNGVAAQDPFELRLGWIRRDGSCVLVETGKKTTSLLFRSKEAEGILEPHAFDVVDPLDAAAPLPHPGFRLGQIWADFTGHSVLISVQPSPDRAMAMDYMDHGNHTASLQTFDFNPHRHPYLVHDPACPWLAPWAPKED
jgi:hypothetical protein